MFSPQEVKELKEQSARLAEQWPRGSQEDRDLIATWRRNRPKMAARLAEQGVLVAFAHLSAFRAGRAEKAYLEAGLPMTDAREQAAAEWLLQEPESEEETSPPEPILNLPLFDQTTGFPTPTP